MVLREIRGGVVITFLAWLGFLGLCGPLGAAKKEEFEPMTRPPMPVGTAVAVYLGERIEIPLEVGGRVVEPLKVLIRRPPRQGTLGEVRILPGGRGGVVEYTPGAKAREGTDSFTFAARSSDSPVSAPARVDIVLRLRPARLEYTREWDFGEVALGDVAVREIRVENSGAAGVELEPKGAGPWEVDGRRKRVAGGGEAVVRLRFQPSTTGDFKSRIPLSADGREFLVAKGRSFAPVEWDSRGLVFSTANRSTGRSAVVFQNTTGRERIVEFEWPGFLKGPREVAIAPDGEAVVEAELDAAPEFTHRGDVGFRSGGFSGQMPLKVEPAPAKLVVEPAGALDLGETAPGVTAKGRLIVKNAGGLGAKAMVAVPEGISVEPDVFPVNLEPGEAREFEILAVPEKSGEFRFEIRVQEDSADAAVIEARVAARAAVPVEKLLSIPEKPAAEGGEPSARVPIVLPRILESTPHSVTLQWPLVEGMRGFFLERAVVGQGGKREWVRWEGVPVQYDAMTASARLRKLPAGTFWHVRLRSLDDSGALHPPPPGFFRIETPPLEPLVPFWAWFSALILLIGAAVWFFKKRVRFVSGP